MIKHKKSDFLIPALSVIFDIIAIELAFLFSFWIRFNTNFLEMFRVGEEIPSFNIYLTSSLIIIPIWLMILNSNKMYAPHRNNLLSDDFFSILKSITLGMLLIIGLAFFYREFSFSRYVVVALWLSAIGLVFGGRIFIYLIRKKLLSKGKELRNAVIIGNNETANSVYEKLILNKTYGYNLLGYFASSPAQSNNAISNGKYLGTIEDLIHSINNHEIEVALITLDSQDYQQIYNILHESDGINVELMLVLDVIGLMTSRMNIKEIEGIPFIKIKGVPITTWGRIIKRFFDFLFSIFVLIIFSPVMIIIYILIKAGSRGSVIYKQERMGLNGEIFNVYKFRTMQVDAEKETGPVWATQEDKRTTRIGKILRRTSLDELPQFINVLRGEMSVVGPRPERPFFVNQFKDNVPKYLDRHLLKSGITGWAQVNGMRGQVSIEDRTKYDLYYIENWSLVLDIKIIVKTIKAVLFGKDAY
ncbi:MAG: undecaprenyl-phosphate glucose phosphotransferase [Bacteroidota bacterium]|nr:undecaprenyl-phosphate glucose phosphotransferase [Bacteroidota bacterium]